MGNTQLAAALNGTAPRAIRQIAAFPSLTFLDCGGGGDCVELLVCGHLGQHPQDASGRGER
eukprot:6149485-Alexandrium_andersonii.AAC.1